MILVANRELHDLGIGNLEPLLKIIDASLSPIHKAINTAGIGNGESNCEQAEYLIGVGFCAIQKYLFDVLQDIKIDVGLARDLGPKSNKGIAIARLIHSAANYWKHEPEWHIWLEELKPNSQKTIDETLHGKDFADYPLSELLADLCNGNTLSLSGCLPYLKEWRAAVYKHTSKNS